ncbi:MAG: hypothetical protein ACFCU1_13260 [Sumerlaeia bacterium]
MNNSLKSITDIFNVIIVCEDTVNSLIYKIFLTTFLFSCSISHAQPLDEIIALNRKSFEKIDSICYDFSISETFRGVENKSKGRGEIKKSGEIYLETDSNLAGVPARYINKDEFSAHFTENGQFVINQYQAENDGSISEPGLGVQSDVGPLIWNYGFKTGKFGMEPIAYLEMFDGVYQNSQVTKENGVVTYQYFVKNNPKNKLVLLSFDSEKDYLITELEAYGEGTDVVYSYRAELSYSDSGATWYPKRIEEISIDYTRTIEFDNVEINCPLAVDAFSYDRLTDVTKNDVFLAAHQLDGRLLSYKFNQDREPFLVGD